MTGGGLMVPLRTAGYK